MQSGTARAGNNFDALRLVAALMVVFGHAYVLSGRAADEPLVRFTGLGGFGELGVSIFFVISGYLVTGSYARLRSLPAYLANRCLRILPGLLVALVATVWVLGPMMTTLEPADYFARPQTWAYAPRNLLLYPVTYALPGVFESNPFPGAVNGSLWTLRLEFTFYLLVPLLCWAALPIRAVAGAAAVAAFVGYCAVLRLGPEATPAFLLIALRNGYLFLAGSALWAWRERLFGGPPWLTVLAAGVFALSLPFEGVAPIAAVGALPALVVGVALRPAAWLQAVSGCGDLSYGVYIYAFPIQQALMAVAGPAGLGVGMFFAATLAVVLPLAAASWWLVEKPALGLKPLIAERLGRRADGAGQEPGPQRSV